jgi:hypothetical protein
MGVQVSFFFLRYWSLNSGPSPWTTPPALFLWRVFQDSVLWPLCLGWLWTVILLISASWGLQVRATDTWLIQVSLL